MAELIKKSFLGGESNPLSRSHVSSMAGGCTYPIYYQRVVNVENGTLLYHGGTREKNAS
jgi:hypothetical protein